jgi:SNF2 family DNA or RNA helicase
MFQNNAQVRVAVLSITAAGAGITLTKSNVVVFAELYWTPGVSSLFTEKLMQMCFGADRKIF